MGHFLWPSPRWDKGNFWWELRACDYYDQFEKPKIIYPVIAKEPRFTYDTDGYFSNDKTFIIPKNDLYLLGLLNSKLCWLFLKRVCSVLGDPDKGGRLELRDIYLKQLPIRIINFDILSEKTKHHQMVSLVKRMLDLHKQFSEAKIPQAKTMLQRQIEAIDRQIDNLVYELYGLSEEEIKVVEGEGH